MTESKLIRAILRLIVCVWLMSLLGGCAGLDNRFSGRSWNQTAAQEQAEHENMNQTSVFGGD